MMSNTEQAKRQKTNDSSVEKKEGENVPLTAKDISLALCRIDDTDKYSTDEVNKALDDLHVWGYSNKSKDERARISKEFIELGGIPRILSFFKENKNNIGFVLRASKVISLFLYSGSNDEHLENSFTMAQKFVEREGVEMILSIIKEKYTGELDINQLNTLDNIFAVFANTMWIMNTKKMVDIDKFSPIIDAGISILATLSNISAHAVAVLRVQENIFIFFLHFVRHNTEMIDVVDFHEKNIFPKCVSALKNPIDNTWELYDNKAWEQASTFFYECCYGNRKILSREGDFEVIVPFLIQFVKVDPDCSSASYAFRLLRKASDTIGSKKMITSNKGLLEVLGTVADCGNDNVANSVKDQAIILMKHLFDGY